MTFQPHHSHHRHHRISSCHRHPAATPVTGLCASCLRERLAGIQSQSPTSEASTSTSTAAAAQLRRSKSFCGGHNPSSSSASEPRRKSCDARARSTLHDLFAVDDRIKNTNPNPPPSNVLDITVLQGLEEEGEFRTMKEFIDLEWNGKKSSRKSFWDTASVFSKKLRKWRRKQEKKKENHASLGLVEPPNVRSLRENQSEVREYGLGRRSCDTDPRLSVDIGRLSVEDSGFSFEEPRASWDGYLIGKQNPRLGVNAAGEERLSVVSEEEKSPGGSAQTRDYYAYSVSSHRRRSFDCAGLNGRMSLGEADDLKSSISNAKVSPETVGLFQGAKLLVTEKELRDSNWYSFKDYQTQSVESAPKDVEFVASGVSQKGYDPKKLPKWKNLLNIWGLIQRQKESVFEDDNRSMGGNVGNGSLVESLQRLRLTSRTANGNKGKSVEGNLCSEKLIESLQKLRRASNAEEERDIEGKLADETLGESLQKLRRVSNADEDRDNEGKVCDGALAESLQKLRRVANGDASSAVVGQKLMRSYSVSCRNSSKVERAFHGTSGETKDDSEKRRENVVSQQNRSVRYSPNNLDNGLLRFYLTPLRSYRRSKSGKGMLKSTQSAGVNVL
ncbi:hypothetical protein SLEP1_g19680 [Rubroshorea leprosula]|uniref:Uncharacterized protein n=1 Tax=Rubroshorea leprosula TaxID=152421 RepID=A0AAV5J5P3_9ROSI|nr:hypothetical protein SLEP1_g19680 [Rubroshorea leprosula]